MRHTSTFRPTTRLALAALGFLAVTVHVAEVRAQGMSNMPGMSKDGAAESTATGTGTVTGVNTAARKITIDHGPMPAIKWSAMKMEFATAQSVDLSKVKAGDKVQFTIKGSGMNYTVQSIAPAN
jgi:Cu(I)/Ag(I) efflux system protein CusF